MTVSDEITTEQTDGINLTDPAVSKVRALLEGEDESMVLRIAVQPGGCSGLRYQLYFDPKGVVEGDVVRDYDGLNVVTDRMSAPYLTGATIDYADTIEKQGFIIDNPQASGSCACGDSFH
ncbi:MAG: iron-sulfur cluster assembly accessory protein [Propionibacteriales bacterium]|nr:iron-sulfur cluster assembly accessory protein [Propionibacteriales bacterium]